jgi:D-sedoheptulose 7-phosphate isomerase
MHRSPLPATVLGINPVVVSAWSNDYAFDTIFSRELEAIGRKGDILIGISTSGNSKNVIEAINAAKARGITAIGLLGQGGLLREMVDIPLCVPSTVTARIQEVHLLLIHIISELVEDILFGGHRSHK